MRHGWRVVSKIKTHQRHHSGAQECKIKKNLSVNSRTKNVLHSKANAKFFSLPVLRVNGYRI